MALLIASPTSARLHAKLARLRRARRAPTGPFVPQLYYTAGLDLRVIYECEEAPHSTTPQFQPDLIRQVVTARDVPAQGASSPGLNLQQPPQPATPAQGPTIVNTGSGNVAAPAPTPPPRAC